MTLTLITNSDNENHIYQSILTELQSRGLTRVDIIVSFIKKSGVQNTGLLEAFELLSPEIEVRIITTDQLGISQFEDAIESLARLENVKLRVFKEPEGSAHQSERSFHAKGWLFHHKDQNCDDLAIIGSSNITHSGLLTGVEWNITVRHEDNNPDAAEIINRFGNEFKKLWKSSEEVTEETMERMRARFLLRSGDWDQIVERYGDTDQQREWQDIVERWRALRSKIGPKIPTEHRQVYHGQYLTRVPKLPINAARNAASEDVKMFGASFRNSQHGDHDISGLVKDFHESVTCLNLEKARMIMMKCKDISGDQNKLIEGIPGSFESPLWFLVRALSESKTQRMSEQTYELMKFLLQNGGNPNQVHEMKGKGSLRSDSTEATSIPIIQLLGAFARSHISDTTSWEATSPFLEKMILIIINDANFEPDKGDHIRSKVEGNFYLPPLGFIASFYESDRKDEYRGVWDEKLKEPFLKIAVQLVKKGARTNLPLGWTKSEIKWLRRLDDCEFIRMARLKAGKTEIGDY